MRQTKPSFSLKGTLAALLCALAFPMSSLGSVVYGPTITQHFCEPTSYLFGCQTLTSEGTYFDTLPSSMGGDSIITLKLSYGSPSYTPISATICGGSFLFGCHDYTQSGVYHDTLQNVSGCDSIITLTLTVGAPSATSLKDTAARGVPYLFGCKYIETPTVGDFEYKDTLLNQWGCDSIVTLSLHVRELTPVFTTLTDTICGGEYLFGCQVLTAGGTYKDTIAGAHGRDSIITLTLTIGAKDAVTVKDTAAKGVPYLFGCKVIETPAVGDFEYKDTLVNRMGCDSIVTLQLHVKEIAAIVTNITDTVCGGEYLFGCQIVTTGGIYKDSLITPQGRDSIVVLTLTMGAKDAVTVKDTVAKGTPYLFGCKIIETPAVGDFTYTDSLTNKFGCDSIVTLNLHVKASIAIVTNITDTICGGDYLFGCQIISKTAPDTYTFKDTLVAAEGQDSIVVLTLTIGAKDAVTVKDTVAKGTPYLFGCRIIQTPNIGDYTYADTLANRFGCDSIITLNLNVKAAAAVVTNITDTICGGDYLFGCQIISKTNPDTYTFKDTLVAAEGQDSIVVLTLTVGAKDAITVKDTVEQGTPYLFGCRIIPTPTLGDYTYADTLANRFGCDSVITLNLNVKERKPIEVTIKDTICGGEYLFGCQIISKSGIYTDSLETDKGQDSIVTLHLNIHTTDTIRVAMTNCDSLYWAKTKKWYYKTQNDTIRTDSVYSPTLTCEAVFILHAVVNHSSYTAETRSECGSYEWHGRIYKESGDYTFIGTTPEGCTLVDTLHLTILPVDSTYEQKRINPGTSYSWHNMYLTETGLYVDTLTNRYGCDSICRLNLIVNDVSRVEVLTKDTVCSGDYYKGRVTGHIINGYTEWTDSVRFTSPGVTVVDSIYRYVINAYHYYIETPWIHSADAFCGSSVDVTSANAIIQEAIGLDPLFAPNATLRWEQQVDGVWQDISQTTLDSRSSTVELRLTIKTDCGTITSPTESVLIQHPTPETFSELDGLLALSKHSDYLLMIHRDSMERELGWDIQPQEVHWYRVRGSFPSYMHDIPTDYKTDIHLGTGYYYTTGERLEGVFYARIFHDPRSVLDCRYEAQSRIVFCRGAERALQLVPTLVRPNDPMRILNLNPEIVTNIKVLTVDGQLVSNTDSEGSSEYEMKAALTSGYYILQVEEDGVKTVLNYIVQ